MLELKEKLIKIFGDEYWFMPLIAIGLLVAGLMLPFEFADIAVYGAGGYIVGTYVVKPLGVLIWVPVKNFFKKLF